MKLDRKELGSLEGSTIYQYHLENDNRMRVQLITLGASIQSILLPYSDGTLKHVVLSYSDWKQYLENPLYFGATLAPNSGRIANASLPIEGKTYQLSQNEGLHNAHGGFHNASLQNWQEESVLCDSSSCQVVLAITLPDGLDGYPGLRCIRTTYTLTNRNELVINYHADTDQPTYLNLSNHTYFNLSGDYTRSALEQQLEIDASSYIANNQEHLPVSVENCANSPFQFQHFTSLSANIASYPEHDQLINALGYNNAFILPSDVDMTRRVLRLKDPDSQYVLELYTDAPGVVLYSGGYIDNRWLLAGELSSYPSCGIALEAQDIPNTPNFQPEQCHYTTPDHPYHRTIQYKFVLDPS